MDYRASGSGADPWEMKGVDPSMLLMDSGKRTGDCSVMRPRSLSRGKKVVKVAHNRLPSVGFRR